MGASVDCLDAKVWVEKENNYVYVCSVVRTRRRASVLRLNKINRFTKGQRDIKSIAGSLNLEISFTLADIFKIYM
jgi:hypothetical protein